MCLNKSCNGNEDEFSLKPKKKGVARNMLQEIKTLVQALNEQRDAYYNRSSPTMTDREYDYLFERLEELEKESGIIFSNSPTQSVGYYPVSELKKVRHPEHCFLLKRQSRFRSWLILWKIRTRC